MSAVGEMPCPHCGKPVPIRIVRMPMWVALMLAVAIVVMALAAGIIVHRQRDPVFEGAKVHVMDLLATERYEEAVQYLADPGDSQLFEAHRDWFVEQKALIEDRMRQRRALDGAGKPK